MQDDIRIVVDIKHRAIDPVELPTDGKPRKPRRQKFLGKRDRSVRVRSIRRGSKLVIEGSFVGYLQGQNVVGSMDLQALVTTVVFDVLSRMKLKPTKEERRKIKHGHIKLERLDTVGLMRCVEFGGPSAVVNLLDAGLVGTDAMRFIGPGESLVYNIKSCYWSMTFYNKALQMAKVYPDTWESLDPRIKKIAKDYIRIELRQLRKELVRLGVHQVRDVTREWVEQQFAARLREVFSELNDTAPHFPIVGKRLDKHQLLGLLLATGHDCISLLPKSTANRIWKKLEQQFDMKRRRTKPLPLVQRKSLKDFQAVSLRHGAPKSIRTHNLVFVAPE